MSILKVLFAALTATPGHTLTFDTNRTPYQSITDWEKTARMVRFSELSNRALAGKCFHRLKQEEPQDLYLAAAKREVADRGPAFPSLIARRFDFFRGNFGSSYEQVMNALWESTEAMPIESDSSYLLYRTKDVMADLRLKESYYLMIQKTAREFSCRDIQEEQAKKEFGCDSDDKMVPTGTPYLACYFYKDLK